MSVADYAENKLVDAIVNGTTTGGGLPTADPWVKMHVGDPTDVGTSNPAGNTTRVQMSFAAASGGSAVSNADATWTGVSTTETYTHISLWDASSAGNCLWTGALTASKAVNSGDNWTLPSGQVSVSLD